MSTQASDLAIKQAQDLIKQGKAAEAAALLDKICNSANQNPMHWYTYALSLAECGKIEPAARAFEQALNYSPSNPMILTALGRAYSLLQQHQNAVDQLTQALQVDPSNRPAAMLLIAAYIKLQQPLQAEALCDNIIKTEPDNAEVLFQLGLIRKLQHRPDEAIELFDQTLARQPDAIFVLMNKGLTLESMGRIDEAISLYQHTTQLAPSNAQVWHILATSLLKRADLTRAIQCFEKSFELNPNNIETGRQLAQALRHVGRTDECETVCKKILEVEPDNAEALFFQNAYSKQKNKETLDRVPADVTRQMYKGKDIGKSFDENLKYAFDYKAPDVLDEAVREAYGESLAANKIDILELGCGSGLCGSRFADIARSLIGTDISADMLEAAKDKNTYSDTYVADLVDALENYQDALDLIIAMDVLCYFGDLTSIFERCFKALRESGIFAFSVVKPKSDAIWELQTQGHFVHSLEHLEDVANKTGFTQIYAKELVLRHELNEDQYGHICLYQKKLI